jgi:hypothetical protein
MNDFNFPPIKILLTCEEITGKAATKDAKKVYLRFIYQFRNGITEYGDS